MSGVEDGWFSASESGASSGSTPIKKPRVYKAEPAQQFVTSAPVKQKSYKSHSGKDTKKQWEDWGHEEGDLVYQQQPDAFTSSQVQLKNKLNQESRKSNGKKSQPYAASAEPEFYAPQSDTAAWRQTSSRSSRPSSHAEERGSGVEEMKLTHRNKPSHKSKKSHEPSPESTSGKLLLNGSAGGTKRDKSGKNDWSPMPTKLSPGTPMLP